MCLTVISEILASTIERVIWECSRFKIRAHQRRKQLRIQIDSV